MCGVFRVLIRSNTQEQRCDLQPDKEDEHKKRQEKAKKEEERTRHM